MKKIHLAMEVVTPAFIGGASPGAEWRTASVRGILRFWFRALAGSELGGDEGRVREAERDVFGSTEASSPLIVRTSSTSSPDAGPLSNRLSASKIADAWKDTAAPTVARLEVFKNGKEILSDPVQYLGYGPFDKGRLKEGRTYLPPRTPLGLDLLQRRALKAPLEDLLNRALKLWLLLGGIGSRNRRGFGSLRCVECSDPSLKSGLATGSVDAFHRAVSEALGTRPAAAGLPGWTHLSHNSSVAISRQAYGDPVQALLAAGSWLVAFRRRYGSPGDSRGTAIGHDYSWGKAPSATAQIPDRAGFGLPLAFEQGKVRVVLEPNPKLRADKDVIDSRRASPLFIHIQRIAENDYRPVLTHLPAQYLHADEKLRLYRDPAHRTGAIAPTGGMQHVIERFLRDLESPGKQLIEQVWP